MTEWVSSRCCKAKKFVKKEIINFTYSICSDQPAYSPEQGTQPEEENGLEEIQQEQDNEEEEEGEAEEKEEAQSSSEEGEGQDENEVPAQQSPVVTVAEEKPEEWVIDNSQVNHNIINTSINIQTLVI